MNAVRLTAFQVRYVNKAFWRNPASAFFTFAFPLMFLVIFTALLGHSTVRIGPRTVNTSTYYVAAMATFAVITACFNNIATAMTFQREDGVLKRTNGTPLPSASFLGARILHALFVALLLVAITVAFGRAFYSADDPDRDHAVAVRGRRAGGRSRVLRARAGDHRGHPERRRLRQRSSTPVILPLEFLSGIFIAFGNNTPGWILWVARVFPVRHFAERDASRVRWAPPSAGRTCSSWPPGAWPGCCSRSASSAGSPGRGEPPTG